MERGSVQIGNYYIYIICCIFEMDYGVEILSYNGVNITDSKSSPISIETS